MTENFERLRQILLKDKMEMPNMIELSVKNDIYNVLLDYFVIDKNKFDLVIDTTNTGEFEIKFGALAQK